MAADHAQTRITLPAEQFRDPPGYVGVRQPVEPEAAQLPPLPPLGRQRERRGGGGNGGVERRVEAGDGRRIGQHRTHRVEGGQRLRLVQRGQVGERPELFPDALVDPDRPAEQAPAVHDPVPDRVHVPERPDSGLDRRRVVRAPRRWQVGGAHHRVRVVEDAQLEAAGPGVDDQDRGQYGHFQSRTSGASSPYSLV